MLFGGHVKTLEDVDFLEAQDFDFGEVILRDAQARRYWINSGLLNGPGSRPFLIAHGPHEGPPNDLDNLWNTYLPALKETVDVAMSLGIHFLTVHLWMDPRFVAGDVRVEKLLALREVVEYGEARAVLISLENLSETASDLKPIVWDIPGLALTLDVGHGQLLTEENTSIAIIDQLVDRVCHVHLHDNRGGQGVRDDLHLPVGEGVVDFKSILEALFREHYQGTLTLELEKEDLNVSREIIRNMLNAIERQFVSNRAQPNSLN